MTPRPLGRVIPAGQGALYADAISALSAAAEAAQAIRAAAEHDATELRARVLAEARQDAMAEAGRILAETARTAQASLAGLQGELSAAIADGVTRVIGSLDLRQAVAASAAHAVSELSERQGVTVRVHNSARSATEAALANWGPALTILGDDELPPDGCVLESNAGFVRADLSAQLAALRSALP